MEVPSSYFVFPLLGLHMQDKIHGYKEFCTEKSMLWKVLAGSGVVKIFLSVHDSLSSFHLDGIL